MGQQQLLLLVLGIVIVGLAVVVGIQAFSENQQKANLDAMVNDGVRIASDLQAWSLKPQAFGGPGTDEDHSDATFDDLGYQTNDSDEYVNLNGTYTLTQSGDDAVIAGTGTGANSNNSVTITVSGTTPSDIETVTSSTAAGDDT